MEQISSLVLQVKQNFLQPLQTELSTQCSNEISIYLGEIANPTIIAQQSAKIQVAFPNLDKLFFTILTERLIKNGFTAQRFKDATEYLIDHFKYPKPSIAEIINFDKKLKLYSHNEVEILINEDKARFDDFHRHWINGVMYRVKKSEVEMFGLERYLKSENETSIK